LEGGEERGRRGKKKIKGKGNWMGDGRGSVGKCGRGKWTEVEEKNKRS
jgi:hypothetical protein